MTERLDRIEQAVERTASNVDDLLGAIAQTDRQVRDLRGESADAKQRFEVLRAEAQNDREETRRLWNDAVVQMERGRTEARERFEAQLTESSRRFDAQQETIQRLLLAVVDLSRDNNRLRDRVDGLEQAR